MCASFVRLKANIRQAKSPIDNLTTANDISRTTVHAYAHEVVEKLAKVHQQVQDILEEVNAKRQDKLNDSDEDEHKLTEGDSVYLHDPTTPVHTSRKLVTRWKGPYVVVRVNDNNTSVILRGEEESLVSNDRLRKVQQGVDSLQQQHQHDIELATQELEVINERMIRLMKRKDDLLSVKEVAEAGYALEEQKESMDVPTHIDRDAVSQASADSSLDDDDSDDDADTYLMAMTVSDELRLGW